MIFQNVKKFSITKFIFCKEIIAAAIFWNWSDLQNLTVLFFDAIQSKVSPIEASDVTKIYLLIGQQL